MSLADEYLAAANDTRVRVRGRRASMSSPESTDAPRIPCSRFLGCDHCRWNAGSMGTFGSTYSSRRPFPLVSRISLPAPLMMFGRVPHDYGTKRLTA